MTRRELVMRALNFEPTARLPKDLGAMGSTSISCFAYPRLVEALGLPPRCPRVYDPMQMLAMPDLDVLDALGCDVVPVFWGVTSAFDQPGMWHPYDFNGRLAAHVRHPKDFVVLPGGTIEQPEKKVRMLPNAYVFDEEHAGQGMDFLASGELPLKDLKQVRAEYRQKLPKEEEIKKIKDLCRAARRATDRAICYDGLGRCELCIHGHGGLAVYPIICMMHPDYAHEYHEILTEHVIAVLEMVLPAITPFIDIIVLAGDDWGNQKTTMASPVIYRDLFLPYYKRVNDTVHRLAPGLKTFMHSCGAIYDLLDDIMASGFDILNPVQWTAGGHSYREWKEKCRGRIALWGGGIDTQVTLPHGTIGEIEAETAAICTCLGEGGGYVFNAIHNLLAEVDPQKVISMYRCVGNLRQAEPKASKHSCV